MNNKLIAEYIWLDSENNFRSKIKVLENYTDLKLDYLPKWNYDGSSTNQSFGKDTEIILNPVYCCNHPFYCGVIVLCETFDTEGNPLPNNHRYRVKDIFNNFTNLKPWYGFEQEYFILEPKIIDNKKTFLPLGYNPKDKQGRFYCGVGTNCSYGREIMSEHLLACIKAGLTVSGTNAEVAPGQWEYQIGPVEGITAGDQLLVSRFLLITIAEKYNYVIDFHPKPLKGDWNGSGCHTNFSTIFMREGSEEKNGYDFILKCIENLEKTKDRVVMIYGDNNEERLTGKHETANINTFSYGVGTRNTSIRINYDTFKNKKGYLEDRRPASNCDPYLVASYLLNNC